MSTPYSHDPAQGPSGSNAHSKNQQMKHYPANGDQSQSQGRVTLASGSDWAKELVHLAKIAELKYVSRCCKESEIFEAESLSESMV